MRLRYGCVFLPNLKPVLKHARITSCFLQASTEFINVHPRHNLNKITSNTKNENLKEGCQFWLTFVFRNAKLACNIWILIAVLLENANNDRLTFNDIPNAVELQTHVAFVLLFLQLTFWKSQVNLCTRIVGFLVSWLLYAVH